MKKSHMLKATQSASVVFSAGFVSCGVVPAGASRLWFKSSSTTNTFHLRIDGIDIPFANGALVQLTGDDPLASPLEILWRNGSTTTAYTGIVVYEM